MGFECEEQSLKLDKKKDVERREFVDKVLKQTVTGVSKVNPLAASATKAYEKLNAHSQELGTIQSTLDRLCGMDEERVKRTLTPNRTLLLAALSTNKELAANIEIELCESTAACDACGGCVKTCPTGARWTDDGTVKTIASYCLGCGLCTRVCSKEGCILSKTDGRVFLGESIDTGIESAKATSPMSPSEKA
jgi:Fe-S-cluster-containing hydrogenase component 2